MTDNLQALIHWLASYDPAVLHTEDDVETKFVLPFFQHLGYPESHRCGKYALRDYPSRKSGRKSEIDQTYFATSDREHQTIGQALVIIEAKRTSEKDLEQARAQALYYSEHMRSLLVAITNGLDLIVLHRRRRGPDEEIFNIPIQQLCTPQEAQRLLDLLSFDTVRRQHAELVDDLSYEKYVQTERALRAHPDIQAILAQGDFEEADERTGRVMRVARTKIQIEGELPICLSGGSCEITFSHILRRGLRIHLNHEEIVSTLLVGMGSPPAWDTRHFIERETEEIYRVRIGSMETRLSPQEAKDLCACIDQFAGAYRTTMMQAEDILDSWNFPMTALDRDPAFYLTSVDTSFWKHIWKFTQTHDWRRGDTDPEWRKFEFWKPGFRIGHKGGDHASIGVVTQLGFVLPTDPHIRHLVYVLPEGQPLPDLDVRPEDWQQNIGANGQWTVQQTYEWLAKHLLPEVERRYQAEESKRSVRFGQTRFSKNGQPYPPFGPVENANQLAPYLEDLQRWFQRYSARSLQTIGIAPAYRRLLDLARLADPDSLELHYATSNMFRITPDIPRPRDSALDDQLRDYFERGEQVATFLSEIPTVSPQFLDGAIRSLYGVFSEASIDAPQLALNRTWTALQPLWRLAQFEQRHVWRFLEEHRY